MTAADAPRGDGGDDERRRRNDDTDQFPRADARDTRDTDERLYDYEDISFSDDEFAGVQGDAPAGGAGGSGGGPGGPPWSTTRRGLPLEDEPSSIVARYLFPTEKFRGEWRHHPIQLVKEIGIGLAATLLMGYATGFLAKHNAGGTLTVVLLLWAFVMFWVVWRIADWYFDRFILTNKRVMVVKGLITRNVGMMPLLRVTDMKYVQSPVGRILNYGTFELESAGQDQALSKIKNLPNPNELYLRIVEEMYEPEAVEARLGRAAAENEDGSGT
jgi:membrane protein YdbS with pleckstrin-like domain